MKQLPFYIIVLFLYGAVLAGCGQQAQALGSIAGRVSVGPLAPVALAGAAEPAAAPEVYADRQIVIFAADGQTEVARLALDGHGNYHGDLPVGTYVVDINHLGLDFAKGLPREIEIVENETLWLDIAIDTGIR